MRYKVRIVVEQGHNLSLLFKVLQQGHLYDPEVASLIVRP